MIELIIFFLILLCFRVLTLKLFRQSKSSIIIEIAGSNILCRFDPLTDFSFLNALGKNSDFYSYETGCMSNSGYETYNTRQWVFGGIGSCVAITINDYNLGVVCINMGVLKDCHFREKKEYNAFCTSLNLSLRHLRHLKIFDLNPQIFYKLKITISKSTSYSKYQPFFGEIYPFNAFLLTSLL